MFKKPDMVMYALVTRVGRDEQNLGLAGQLASLVYLVSARSVTDPVLKTRETVDETSEINLWSPKYTPTPSHTGIGAYTTYEVVLLGVF